MTRHAFPLLLLLVCAACGDDDGPVADGGGDAAALTCEGVPEIEPGDPEGHAAPLGAVAGEARAGRLGAAELPPNPTGLSTVAAGDFVLANDRVAVIVEDVGASDIYDPWGGKIVGLALNDGGTLVEPADFEEALIGLGRYTVQTTSVTVIRDGSGGGPAVVRALGTLAPLPVIDEIASAIIPGDYRDVVAAIDYVLEPDSEQLGISMTVRWNEARPLRIPTVLHAFIQANRMQPWIAGGGFDIGNEPVQAFAFVKDDAASYLWSSTDGDLSPLLSDTGFSGLAAPAVTLTPCSAETRPMASVVVGGPGLDGVLLARSRVEERPRRAITGTVEEAGGAPASGARVHAVRPDGGHLTRVTVDADGAFTLHVDEAETEVDLVAYDVGVGLSAPVRAASGDPAPLLTLPDAGFVHVTAREVPTDTALPVRVQVVPSAPLDPVPDSFGEVDFHNGRIHIAYPIDGEITLPVAVGDHRVIVSHGYEYEMVDRAVTVAPGATEEVDAPLERVVDTTGILCGDFHIHTHRSLDSTDEVRMKVASAVADGVEVLVRSEHEWVADFEPTIAELGLGDWAFGVCSEELSTLTFGHFGVFPLTPDPTAANGGALEWAYVDPPTLFDTIRSLPERPALIINHPRATGLANGKGYFENVGYDPSTGMVAHPDRWDDGFTLIEVFNSRDFRSNRDGTVRDWLSFLAQGRRVFAVGSSDSHRVSTDPVGYPRTCLRFDTDDPRALSPDLVRDVLESGAVTVSGGIYIDAVVDGAVRPGGEQRGASPRTAIEVVVQAASWVDVDSLEVIVDGATVETLPIDDSTADPMMPTVRLRATVEVDVADGPLGSQVILVAAGDMPLDPVHPGRRPFAVTNPIFLFR